jgi:hypothetical protein
MTDSASAKSLHSWELDTWPPDVWPHTTKRAKWISKAYRKELIAAKAITRVGKTIVFVGAAYTRWLERRSQHVVEFVSNNPALKRTNVRTLSVPRA